MNRPTLHYHPLSSYCQKVLIAIEVLGADVELALLNLGDTGERNRHLARWPMGKMPLLVDQGRALPESSIIIEHLQHHHARPGRRLLPEAGDAALDVRLWDRFFDQYVMTPMQKLTADLLRPEGQRDARGVAEAREMLLTAYAVVDERLAGRSWVAADGFSLADCAAAPSLFFAHSYVPLPAAHGRLHAYFERLLAHPAVAAVLDQARPFLGYFPGRAGLEPRFLAPTA